MLYYYSQPYLWNMLELLRSWFMMISGPWKFKLFRIQARDGRTRARTYVWVRVRNLIWDEWDPRFGHRQFFWDKAMTWDSPKLGLRDRLLEKPRTPLQTDRGHACLPIHVLERNRAPEWFQRWSTKALFGDSDVSDIVYVGDFMMVTDFRCWRQNHYVGDFFRYVGDFVNVLNRSPTSWIDHQQLKLVTNTFGLQHPSPTSM